MDRYYIIWYRIETKDVHWWVYVDPWQGESFYNPYIANVIGKLDSKGLIEESEGARVIFLQGFKIPLIVVKSDGGFNYASTDLTALWCVIFSSTWTCILLTNELPDDAKICLSQVSA